MRLQLLNSAIFVTLFIALIPVAIISNQKSEGLPVYIAEQPKNCGDGRVIVVYVHRDGSLKLNAESLQRNELERRLHDVFKTMAERLLIVKADPDVLFQEVAQVIDSARTQVDYVALLTPSVEKEANEYGVWCLTVQVPPKQPSGSIR